MILLIGLLSIIAIFLALFINKDLFSPSKWYLLSLVIYFFDIYITPQYEIIYFIYTIFLLLGILFIFLEKKLIGRKYSDIKNKQKVYFNEKKILLILWTISLIPIFAQLYLIYYMGGFLEYMLSIKLRVVNWQGLGYVFLVLKIYPIVNIFYLLLGLIFSIKHKNIWWGLFLLHLSILIFLGLLSGSRGGTLFGIVFIVISLHYFIKKISLSKILIIIFTLLIIASFLEVMRNGFKYSDEGFDSKTENIELSKTKLISYGLMPLNIILEDDYSEYKYGSTFISAFTNIIPRKIWSEKLDTGGVILTRFRAGASNYTGTSNYSPGLFTESILNFGYLFGPIFFLLIMSLFMIISVYIYRYFLNQIVLVTKNIDKIKITYYYFLTMSIPGGLLYGEFTNILFNMYLKLILFFILFFMIDRAIKIKEYKEI